MTRSALVVRVADAEPFVGALRLAHDSMAPRGVPAHITVLHPFRDVVDDATAAEVAELAATLPSFEAVLARVGSFPQGVVFLEPEPIDRFKAMTRAVFARFPDRPPYGGAFDDPHPHLTIGNRVAADDAPRISAQLEPHVPLAFRVDRLTLLVEDDDGLWTVDRSWPLGDG